jgi:excinuclease ABC subunit A
VSPEQEYIRLRGVRVHNLCNLDLDIPRDRLVVITGPSGSGKSSLALDTIYAEGHRQFVETLSTFARQFLQQLERPDVDLVEGLEPTIAIDQRPATHNPRSTVATVTEIYDHLRLAMARLGQPHCPACQAPICQQSPEQILDDLLGLPEGAKAMLLAPLVRGRKGQHGEVLETVRKAGLVRVRINGQVLDLDQVPPLSRRRSHTIEAVVDRIIIRQRSRDRIAESLQLALKHGLGVVVVSYQEPTRTDRWHDRLYNTHYACPACRTSFLELEPRTFSFNSPYGACPECAGIGYREQFDPELVLPERNRSLAQGAIAPWRAAGSWTEVNRGDDAHRRGEANATNQDNSQRRAPPKSSTRGTSRTGSPQVAELESLAAAAGGGLETPLAQWPPGAVEKLLQGDGGQFKGLLALLEAQFAETHEDEQARLGAFRRQVVCSACQGSRLRPEARCVRLGGLAIHEIAALSIERAAEFFGTLRFTPQQEPVAARVIPEISSRLRFLCEVGVGYLTLDRPAQTLSGGEAQRVRLAAGLGSALVGACYVLDEPSMGLHPRDTTRLIAALRSLQRLGNSVLVVEHDEAVMRSADYLIDLGPGAGRHGGRVMAQGTPEQVCRSGTSLTGKYLAHALEIPLPACRRPTDRQRVLVLEGASLHNLREVTLRLPLRVLSCITGVSGSGKSSLINETLAPALSRALGTQTAQPGPYRKLEGLELIDKLIQIDQSPIGRTPRSNPATYTGLFDDIRQVFAETKAAKLRGFRASRFSFNTAGGRCEECQGQGWQRIEMHFLPDLLVKCPTCQGRRFNRQTLEVLYRDRSIADVLDLTVDEAAEFFENFPRILRMLTTLQDVGLGYLTLGQPSTTLSGGEAQRVKLATELARDATGNTLYILDEPTTGLHFEDVKHLLTVLDRLVDAGNTVVVIEHHPDVMKRADWIIDLGPEGGAAGGQIVAEGTPEEIAALAANDTAECLRRVLKARG